MHQEQEKHKQTTVNNCEKQCHDSKKIEHKTLSYGKSEMKLHDNNII